MFVLSLDLMLFLLPYSCLMTNLPKNSEVVYTAFTQLADCPVNYVAKADFKTHASSLLDCAIKCAENATCLSFNQVPASHTSIYSYDCGLVDVRAKDCSDLQFVSGARHYQISPACHSQPWQMVLSQQNGIFTNGSLSNLIKAVQQGSQLRLLIEGSPTFENELQLFNVDSAWVINETVVAQVFTFSYVSLGNSVEPRWTKLQASVHGLITMIVHKQTKFEYLANMQWFVKATDLGRGFSPIVFDINTTDTFFSDIHYDIISAIQEGFPIHMVENSGQNKWRSVPLPIFLLQPWFFVLLSAWTDSSLEPSALENEILVLINRPILHVASFSNFDIMKISSYNETFHTVGTVFLAIDFCWDKIYVHDENGYPEYGSYNDLVDRILSGSAIRAAYQCYDSPLSNTMSIDRLSEDGVVISAYISYPISDSLHRSFSWVREELHTNGTINKMILDRTDGNETWISCQARISWLADRVQRDEYWYYDKENVRNSADFSSYPIDHFYNGLMPTVVIRGEDGVSHAYNLQRMTYAKPDDGNKPVISGMNYRSFDESYLSVNYFNANHSMFQNKIRMDTEPGSVGDAFHSSPFSIIWYI